MKFNEDTWSIIKLKWVVIKKSARHLAQWSITTQVLCMNNEWLALKQSWETFSMRLYMYFSFTVYIIPHQCLSSYLLMLTKEKLIEWQCHKCSMMHTVIFFPVHNISDWDNKSHLPLDSMSPVSIARMRMQQCCAGDVAGVCLQEQHKNYRLQKPFKMLPAKHTLAG